MGWLNESIQTTAGQFVDEPASCQAFDDAIERSGWFRVHREVRGEYLFRRPGCEQAQPRIDRILVPTSVAMAAGWSMGFVGVEIKKSGTKLGKIVAQCMDYATACWRMPNGCRYVTEWVFIFPAEQPIGDLASVMAQHRIGTAKTGYSRGEGRSGIILQAGGLNVFENVYGAASCKPPVSGTKVGSR